MFIFDVPLLIPLVVALLLLLNLMSGVHVQCTRYDLQ